MVVVFGFSSLAVDLGAVQMAKTQLQGAVDAAARSACKGLTISYTQAQTDAVTTAGYNTVNGTAYVLATSDIDFGTWDTSGRTFTILTGAARSTANSVRVNGHMAVALTMARVVGISTVTIHAYSTAMTATATSPYGIVGLTSMNNNNNGVWDSYDATAGVYSAGSAHSLATVASNSNITLNSSSVKGDVHPGVGKTVSGGTVTGSRTALTSAVSYPSVSAGTAATTNNNTLLAGPDWSSPNFNHSGSSTITIPAGTYYVQDFKVTGNATVNLTGAVVMYIYGDVNINSSTVNAYQSKPTNFKIYLLSGSTFQLRTNTSVQADIYGPDTDMSFSGASTLYGRVIGLSLQQTGNGSIHQDESLSAASGSGTISVVK